MSNHNNRKNDNTTITKKNKKMTVLKSEAHELDPFEIEFLPEFTKGRGPREPFINEHGVVIGDHEYTSPHSPLEQWSEDTDPAIMAGDQWVHPFKDIGFHSPENKDYFEKGILPGASHFMHPDEDVTYGAEFGESDADEEENKEQ